MKHYVQPAHNVYVIITYENERLSFMGVESPMSDGNSRGSCGQIQMHVDWHKCRTYFYDKLAELWKRWHLNDMRAGSPIQEEWIRQNPPERYDYVEMCRKLEEAGLNPDPEGYKYGTQWKFEKVPQDVIDYLFSLPQSLPPERWR